MRTTQILTIATLVLVLTCAGAWASDEYRSSFLPNVGAIDTDHERHLGDMWTFNCPAGGRIRLLQVDTKDDTDTGAALIDPILFLIDGHGNRIATADDTTDCTYALVSGHIC